MVISDMLRVVIVDDEERARSGLKKILTTYIENVEVVGLAESAQKGVELIKETAPDLVFLDVDMPGGDGFQLMNAFDVPDFEVIFVTAYEQYAIKAIKYAALDYLMKPVDIEELDDAVARVLERRHNPIRKEQYSLLQNGLKQEKLSRLAVPLTDGISFIEVEDVVAVNSDGSYSEFVLQNGTKLLVSRNLGEYEALLSSNGFHRIHHSHLINLKKVTRYVKGRGGYVVMSNGNHYDVSVRRKDGFLEAIQNMG